MDGLHSPPIPSQTSPATRFDAGLIPCGLFLLALLVYLNSFPGTFIQDDLHIVRNNPLVAGLDLWRILRSEYWQGIESSGLYRPLTIFSFALNQRLLGSEAWAYHLVNTLLHAGVTVLCWRMLRCWDFSRTQALLAGLLFAVHPIHTEVVNQMVGRSELLAACFLLLALASARGEGPRAAVLTCSFYLAALLSKEHAITFLGLLPLLDGLVDGWPSLWRRRARLYGALLIMTAAWLLWRKFGVIHEFPPTVLPPEVAPLAYLSWGERLLSAVLLQGLYLLKLVLPLTLQGSYAASDLPDLVTTPLSVPGLLAVLGLALTIWLVACGLRRRHPLGIPALLYLVSFLLTSNLFFPIGVTFAERLAYFPSVWFCAGTATVLAPALQWKRRPWVGVGLTGVYLVLLATLTLLRNPDFSSELRYWGADVRKNPRDHLALVNYAELLAADGRFPEAEAAYRQLFELSPAFAYGYRSRTNFLINQRRFDEALASAQQALALARQRGDRTAAGYDLGDLARIHLERKEYALALSRLDESAEILGPVAFDLELRGAALAGLGRSEEALQAFSKAGKTVAAVNVALTLFNAGRLKDARSLLEGLTHRDGADAESWNLLGVVCAQMGDWTAAAAAFKQATVAAPDNAYYRDNLRRAQQSREGRGGGAR